MKFDELNATIPYAVGGKPKSLTMAPYSDITLALPGRHAKDTDPVGGDFVVMVTCDHKKWRNHQFTHGDLFKDLEIKATQSPYQDLVLKDAREIAAELMRSYLRVVRDGVRPASVLSIDFDYLHGLRGGTFLRAVQCLAVAEHRRYARYESAWGGRFLPLRFSAGIVEGLWTAADAIERQKRGRPGVEWLERDFGTPVITKELMS